MAVLRETDSGRAVTGTAQIAHTLRAAGIDYERWEPASPLDDGASPQEVLDTYAAVCLGPTHVPVTGGLAV